MTHQLQPGVGHQHLVLLILRTETEKRRRGKEGISFYFIQENQDNQADPYLIHWKTTLLTVSQRSCFAHPKQDKAGYVKLWKSWFYVTEWSSVERFHSGADKLHNPYKTKLNTVGPTGFKQWQWTVKCHAGANKKTMRQIKSQSHKRNATLWCTSAQLN